MNSVRRTRLFIGISAALHLAVYLKLFRFGARPEEPQKIEVEVRETVPVRKTARPKPVQIQQIVEQDKAVNQNEDESTKYLSAFNQKLEKQTRAQATGKFQNGEKEPVDLSAKFAVKEKGDLPQPKVSKNTRSQSDDYLNELEEGMRTLVNTREFGYYAYFSRIKESLREQWEPDLRRKVTVMRAQERRPAAADDATERTARLLVTLDKFGNLVNVKLLRSSGNTHLDNLALDAFTKAAPFPNPPSGLVEPDGHINIRWDFVLAI